MGLAHQSVATISSPEFINLQPLDLNPGMTSCDIKVLYIGQNRNQTFISKQVAAEMAKSLRGAPIVGYYKTEQEDFRDHGEQVTIDGDGIHFKTLTKPYGFVAPDAQVWFKDFQDSDDFGNTVVRTYLMTTGYLWTGQFQEASQVFKDNGKPQSMELDKNNLHGKWTTDINKNVDFFIINDAIFTKLCILGDDVEPCFEGAGVLPTSFTLDDDFKNSLFNMLQDLKNYTLAKGGSAVADIKDNQVNESALEKEPTTNFENAEQPKQQENKPQANSPVSSTFVKEDDKEKNNNDENDSGDGNEEENNKEKDDDKDKKYALLDQQYSELKANFESLQAQIQSLREFKLNAENEAKDAMINKFSMLSEEDKKEVIEHKSEYTVEQIEEKLALIGYRKGVNFSLEEPKENDNKKEESITTYNINEAESVPDWVKAVEQTMKNI